MNFILSEGKLQNYSIFGIQLQLVPFSESTYNSCFVKTVQKEVSRPVLFNQTGC